MGEENISISWALLNQVRAEPAMFQIAVWREIYLRLARLIYSVTYLVNRKIILLDISSIFFVPCGWYHHHQKNR